jgi:hypothetical protein
MVFSVFRCTVILKITTRYGKHGVACKLGIAECKWTA